MSEQRRSSGGSEGTNNIGAQRVPAVDEKKAQVDRAVLENVLTQLRQKSKELDQDSWVYEAPRCTYR
ncbi:g8164 [Coccomyxa elongata]